MNICTRNCKHYEYCIPFRYNNIQKDYMKAVEVSKTKDGIEVIYVKKCNHYEKIKGFCRLIGVSIKNARHSQKQKVERKKKTDTKAR